MRHRLTLYTLLFLHHPLLYGQEHLVERSSTFREVPCFWLLPPVSTRQTTKNLHLDGQWNHHPLSPSLCKWTKHYQDDFSFHCFLSAQAQKKHNQWSWGQLWYTEVRYKPWKKIQHWARLTLSSHTGPDALLDYPYTISLPYGFPQAFSLGQVHLVNSLTIRWQKGIRIAILHNSKITLEDSLHRVHLQLELSLH